MSGRLYQKSCQRMEELNENSIDLIVTSPPYWIDSRNDLFAAALAKTEYEPITGYADFLIWLQGCFAECFHVLKPGGFCCVIVATTLVKGAMYPLPFHLVARMEEVGFTFHQDILWHRWRGWDKRGGNVIKHPYPGYYLPNRVIEYVLVFVKPGGKRIFAERTEEERQRSRIVVDDLLTKEIAQNLWHIAPVMPGTSPHPCPFPEELAYRLITLYSYAGETVLDPFLGSGTTAKVAKLTGRNYVGYEMQPEFLRLSKKRLKEKTIERQDWIQRFERAGSGNVGKRSPSLKRRHIPSPANEAASPA